MAECLICSKDTGGEYKLYCPDHKPTKARKTTKRGTPEKIKRSGLFSRVTKQCKDCGKTITGYGNTDRCKKCYRQCDILYSRHVRRDS